MNFDNIYIPDEEIFEIAFFTKKDFYPMELVGKTYVIFAHDRSNAGTFFGVAEDGAVYKILRRKKMTYYAMNSLENFIKALEKWEKIDDSYLTWGAVRDLIKLPDKDVRVKKLEKTIRRLDPKALDKDTYWSSVIEDIHPGIY